MDIFSALMAGSLFALACNLDTVLAAVGQGARGIPLGPRELFTAAGVTTAVTFLSLELGALGASFLPAGLAEKLGGLALAFGTYWTPSGAKTTRLRRRPGAGLPSLPLWRSTTPGWEWPPESRGFPPWWPRGAISP